jgi:hypothetical protein
MSVYTMAGYIGRVEKWEEFKLAWKPLMNSENIEIFDPVPIENLNPDVLMMDPAEDRYRSDAAELLDPPKIWSILIQ